MRSSANPIYAPAWFLQMGISTCAVLGQRRRTERGLSSPQEAPLAQPGCELGAGRRSNDAADWKVRAPRFAPAFTDRILEWSLHPALSWQTHPFTQKLSPAP